MLITLQTEERGQGTDNHSKEHQHWRRKKYQLWSSLQTKICKDQYIKDLEKYIDDLLMRVMETTPKLLQNLWKILTC